MGCLRHVREAVSTALFVAWVFGPLIVGGLLDRVGLLDLLGIGPEEDVP